MPSLSPTLTVMMVIALLLIAAVLALLFVFVFGSVAQRRRGEEQYALPAAADATDLDRAATAMRQGHHGESGLLLLSSNIAAFKARLETIRRAGRSLDLPPRCHVRARYWVLATCPASEGPARHRVSWASGGWGLHSLRGPNPDRTSSP